VVQRVLEHGRWSSICRAWVGHGVRRERVHSRQSLRRARAQQPWKTRASVRPGLDVAGPGALLGGLRRAGAVGGVAAVVGDALALRLPLVRRRRGRGAVVGAVGADAAMSARRPREARCGRRSAASAVATRRPASAAPKGDQGGLRGDRSWRGGSCR
jgi:hypothetical protein